MSGSSAGSDGRDGQFTAAAWIGLWLERVATANLDAAEEAERILQEAPPAMRPLLRSEFAQIISFAEAALSEFGLRAGSEVGPYVLERKLGNGSSSSVWEATDPSGRRFAVKLLNALYLGSREGLERLTREVEAASRLRHPGLVPILDTVDEEPYFALVSELVGSGVTLGDEIRSAQDRGSEVDAASRLRRLLPLIEAVGALHEAGICHFDIKPDNILIDELGALKLTDFGLARLDDSPELTRTHQVLGTPAYMAPELAAGERRSADQRADVFSLGVTLFELITLRRPFEANERRSLFEAILRDEPARLPGRLQGLGPRATRRLRSVLGRCLEKRSARRYANANELAREIASVLSGGPVGGLSVRRRASSFAKRHRTGIVVGVATLALLALAYRDRELKRNTLTLLRTSNRFVAESIRPGGSMSQDEELSQALQELRPALSSVSDTDRLVTLESYAAVFAMSGGNSDYAIQLYLEALDYATAPQREAEILFALAELHERRGELATAYERFAESADVLGTVDTTRARTLRAWALLQAQLIDSRFRVASGAVLVPGRAEVLALAREQLGDGAGDRDPMRARLESGILELERRDLGATASSSGRAVELAQRLTEVLPPAHPWVIDAMLIAGAHQHESEDYSSAEAQYRSAFERARGGLGAEHILTSLAQLGLARAVLEQGRHQEALEHYSDALQHLERQLGADNHTVLRFSVGKYVAMDRVPRPVSERAEFVRSLESRSRDLPQSDPVRLLIGRAAIEIALVQCDYDEARARLQRQWDARRQDFPEQLPAAAHEILYAIRAESLDPRSEQHIALIDARLLALREALSTSDTDPEFAAGLRETYAGLETQLTAARLSLLGDVDGTDSTLEGLIDSTDATRHDQVAHWRARARRVAGDLQGARSIVERAIDDLGRPDDLPASLWCETLRVHAALGDLEPARAVLDLPADHPITAVRCLASSLVR